MSATYDGDYDVATPIAPGRKFIAPFDDTTKRYVYEEPYTQKRDKFKPLPISTRGIENYYLVEESDLEPDPNCGDIVTWTRTYARVPKFRIYPESFGYSYQDVFDGEIIETNMEVASFIRFDYFFAPGDAALKIPLAQRRRLSKINGVIYEASGSGPLGLTLIGSSGVSKHQGIPTVDDRHGNAYIVAENAKLKRWMGEIYERATRYVPRRQATGAIYIS